VWRKADKPACKLFWEQESQHTGIYRINRLYPPIKVVVKH